MNVEEAVKLIDWLNWFMRFMYFHWVASGKTGVCIIPDAVWDAKYSLSYDLKNAEVVVKE